MTLFNNCASLSCVGILLMMVLCILVNTKDAQSVRIGSKTLQANDNLFNNLYRHKRKGTNTHTKKQQVSPSPCIVEHAGGIINDRMFLRCSTSLSSVMDENYANSQRSEANHCKERKRRRIITNTLTLLTSSIINSRFCQAANAAAPSPPPNPLNLKGTFWETGAIYQKSDVSKDPNELLDELREIAVALKALSEESSDTLSEIETISRRLRGGNGSIISESRLRTRAFAVIGLIEDAADSSRVSDLFRAFLVRYDALDSALLASSGPQGVASSLGLATLVSPLAAYNQAVRISESEKQFGTGDVRLNVLAAFGEANKSLGFFIKEADKAIEKQEI
eukprot:CAMPEP_0171299992 /NCGR_PEP_ID=MMETSP0816-20121228/8844_1 /TAXON_ID=420281 /ORGANISM="Proboscia inermis, Strain CCAP1064/1" /LENGTH=335 /DNA_ID=CAMNT_0011776223 /DNA_START=58 /DNA_END=1065 /DNA_ORIENTATION=+